MNARIGRGTLMALMAGTMLAQLPNGAFAPAMAQETARVYAFDIPARAIRAAMNDIVRISGIDVAFAETPAASARGNAVRGTMTPEQAVARLLAGSGLSYRFTDANTVTILDKSQTSGAVTNEGAGNLGTIILQAGPATEGTNSYTTNASTIGKTAETLRETPQSVSVITSRQIADRGLSDLGQALNTATGVTVTPDQYYSAGRFFARGFEITNLRLDGGAVGVTSTFDAISSVGLSRYDRVEVLRGADGLFSGNGEAGGVISLARKRPLAGRQSTVELGYSDFGPGRASYDFSTPLNAAGSLRARLIVSTEKGDAFYDLGKRDNRSLYAIFEADLGDNTVLTFGGSYDRQKSTPWSGGLPRYLDGSDIGLAVETSLGTDWASLDHKGWEVFAGLRHDFGAGWVWNSNLTYARHDYLGLYGYMAGAVDPATGDGLVYNGSHNWGKGYQLQADSNLAGQLDLFGLPADVVVGLDYAKHSSDVSRAEFTGPAVNLANIGSQGWPISIVPTFPGDYRFNFHPYEETRFGAYGRAKLHLNDTTRIMLGMRYGSYRFSFHRASYNRDGSVNWTEALDYADNGVLTPFAAISHDLNGSWTAYASYAAIYQSQSRYLSGPEPGLPLDPITGETFKTGLKGELFDGAVNTSLAAYYTRRQGEAVYDPRYSGAYNPGNGSNCCYTDSGEVTSKGIDLEISGEVAPGLQLFAGYTLNLNKNSETDALYSSVTPKHMLKIWGNYTLPGEYSAWSLGAGARVQSATGVSGTEWVSDGAGGWVGLPFDFGQSGYAVADISVRYDFNEKSSLVLNVNNLFDRRYYAQLGTLSKNNFYGAPREIALTFRSTF
ncbi:TonB-dependent siderophore receptor [Xinfangfangia sp. D13-10-4-6]|uniref:TonB-dependent siderophore receptor n=1 Tax=Pseudogemmobacter hezensis TaxID=2737662 RepID=UPI001557C4D2|nr:TonB-dependent siderophore receptor [Pseudogemmobacter hezensis]NPD16066.1 TonB-dependent siderophore receptor [Pseudogemmobacter hezensis]